MISPDEVAGDINDTLAEDVEQFNGEGESRTIPSTHIRITSADLATIAQDEVIVIDEITLTTRQRLMDDPPDNQDKFGLALSEMAIKKLARGDLVNYGIRHVNGRNQFVVVSCGGVSDKLGKERPPLEIEKERHPEL